MSRLVYTTAFRLLLPFILLRLWWRGRKLPGYRAHIAERFGRLSPSVGVVDVWLHAVSVGEAQAALPLAQALLDRGLAAHFTTTTPTGRERVRQTLGARVSLSYVPYDLPMALARVLDRLRPRLLVVMETELWPNLFHACHARGIAVCVVNARLSEQSARGYRRVGTLTRATLAATTLIAAQSEADAARFLALGAPRVEVTGNLKYDAANDEAARAQGRALREGFGVRPVWIAASTHAGEEELMLAAHARVRESLPDALLLLVPRHPERFEAVARLCLQSDGVLARRAQHDSVTEQTTVYLCDTMGELPLLYAASDLAFVGGSLAPVGGHNPLEAVALGVPVLMGPQHFNFAEIGARLLAADAALVVRDEDELTRNVKSLLGDPAQRARRGAAGRQVVERERGALQRMLTLLDRHIG
jgi:3-deoxy-D-manno-octulosonic-acid transferase